MHKLSDNPEFPPIWINCSNQPFHSRNNNLADLIVNQWSENISITRNEKHVIPIPIPAVTRVYIATEIGYQRFILRNIINNIQFHATYTYTFKKGQTPSFPQWLSVNALRLYHVIKQLWRRNLHYYEIAAHMQSVNTKKRGGLCVMRVVWYVTLWMVVIVGSARCIDVGSVGCDAVVFVVCVATHRGTQRSLSEVPIDRQFSSESISSLSITNAINIPI